MEKKELLSKPITAPQFELVAKLLQSKEPPRTAAYLVLVENKSNKEAIAATGLSPQSVSNTLGRYRRAHAAIMAAYGTTADHNSEG